jgi:hypothetical protein
MYFHADFVHETCPFKFLSDYLILNLKLYFDSITIISVVMTPGKGLTTEQIATFEQDGYLIIPNALPEETVSQLLKETHSLLEDFSLEDHPMTRFSTGEGSEHVGDDYFLSSGDKIRFFFEEGMIPTSVIFIRKQ